MWAAYKKFWKDALHLEKTATRAEFWWGVLALLLTEAILWGIYLGYFAIVGHGNINEGVDSGSPLSIFPTIWLIVMGTASIVMLIAFLFLILRRMNDARLSKLWLLLLIVPVFILWLAMLFQQIWLVTPLMLVMGLGVLVLICLCQMSSKPQDLDEVIPLVAGDCVITITRRWAYSGSVRKFKIFIDGNFVGGIKVNQSKTFKVAAGSHNTKAKLDYCGSNTLTVETGETAVALEVRGRNIFQSFIHSMWRVNEYLILQEKK
jgi:uncharacterized membrane protein YhaH (DUF805 family)